MPRVKFENGKLTYDYDEAVDEESEIKDKVAKDKALHEEKKTNKEKFKAKEFKTLTRPEKDDLLLLLLKLHDLI